MLAFWLFSAAWILAQPVVHIGTHADVNESAGVITVPVYSTQSGSHSVRVVSSGGSATFGPGGDYMFTSSSTVSFNNTTVAYVNLQIINDNVCEALENMCLVLTDPVGCYASPQGSMVQIWDDDAVHTVHAQGFENTAADNWAFNANPSAYNSETGPDPLNIVGPEHVWSRIKGFVGGFGAFQGQHFWGFSNLTSSAPHTLDFAPIAINGADHAFLRFRYITYNFSCTDDIEYWVAFDNSPNWNSANVTTLSGNTQQWVTVTTPIPANAQYVRLRIKVQQGGCQVCGGIDDIALVVSDCQTPASVSIGTVPNSLCGTGLQVPFSSAGTFLAGNVFSAQLSNANGSFANAATIGSVALSGTGPSGMINAVLPSGLVPGTGYRIRVVSSNPAAVSPDNGFNITINPLQATLTAQIYPNGLNVSCPGAQDGSVQAVVTQGQGPFTYHWTGPGGFSSSAQNLSNVGAGLYTLSFTDAAGCVGTASIHLQAPTLNAFLAGNPISCHGAGDGSIQANVTGTGAPFSYQWVGPGGFSSSNAQLTGLEAGLYALTVTDQYGCNSSLQYIVQEPDSLTLSAVAPLKGCGVHVSCANGADGSIDLSPLGGTPGLQYQWTGPNGFQSGQQDPTGLVAGTYAVTVTDARGCSGNLTITLLGPTPLTGDLTAPLNACGYQVSCHNGADGQISLDNVGGGCAPYQLAWSNGDTSAQLSGLAAGTYTMTITDANGCTLQRSISLTQPDALGLDAQVVPATCANSPDGSIDLSVSGGCGNYTYSWTGTGNLVSNAEDLSELMTGTYQVTVTDGMGCSVSGSYDVLTLDNLSAHMGCCQDTAICLGDSVLLRVDFTGQGPWMLGYLEGTVPHFVTVNSSPYYIVAQPTTTIQYKLTMMLQGTTDCPGWVCGEATVAVNPCDTVGCEDLCVNTGVLSETVSGICRTVTLEVACDTACNNKTALQTGGACLALRTLDFDRAMDGSPMPSGKVATTQWAALGITISARNNNSSHPDSALVFNSAWPTGNDLDLGTPNIDFGGLGIGTGGGLGMPGQNAYGLANLLVIAEDLVDANLDGFVDSPSDDNTGGELILSLNTPRYVESVKVVDLDNGQGQVRVRQASGAVLLFAIPQLGNNAVTDVMLQTDSVVEVAVIFAGEGALAELKYCPDPDQNAYLDISIPCGQVSSYSNSAGLPMYPITNDLLTGITGLRVVGLPGYCQDSSGLGPFTVSYTLCDSSCTAEGCLPLVAYIRDGCIQYEDAVTGSVATPLPAPERTVLDDIAGLQVTPNPAQGRAYARFYLKTASHARVDLIDLRGQVQVNLWEGVAEAEYPYAIGFETGGLASGMYLLRLASEDGIKVVTKFVVAP